MFRFYIYTVFDLSKKAVGVEAPRGDFKIVHSGAFSCTNSKVLLAIKCRERYVTMIFFAIDSDKDIKTSSFHQSRNRNLRPVSH